MVKIYYDRLLLGKITFDMVPGRYQDKVKDLAKSDIKAGKLSVLEYEQIFDETFE